MFGRAQSGVTPEAETSAALAASPVIAEPLAQTAAERLAGAFEEPGDAPARIENPQIGRAHV